MSTMSKKTPMQKNGTQNNGRKAASERERERNGREGGWECPGVVFFPPEWSWCVPCSRSRRLLKTGRRRFDVVRARVQSSVDILETTFAASTSS